MTEKNEFEVTMKTTVYICPVHGDVTEWVEVHYGDGYEHDGKYCQKCYVENVLVPNCKMLEEKSDEQVQDGAE